MVSTADACGVDFAVSAWHRAWYVMYRHVMTLAPPSPEIPRKRLSGSAWLDANGLGSADALASTVEGGTNAPFDASGDTSGDGGGGGSGGGVVAKDTLPIAATTAPELMRWLFLCAVATMCGGIILMLGWLSISKASSTIHVGGSFYDPLTSMGSHTWAATDTSCIYAEETDDQYCVNSNLVSFNASVPAAAHWAAESAPGGHNPNAEVDRRGASLALTSHDDHCDCAASSVSVGRHVTASQRAPQAVLFLSLPPPPPLPSPPLSLFSL